MDNREELYKELINSILFHQYVAKLSNGCTFKCCTIDYFDKQFVNPFVIFSILMIRAYK